jgi:hypothetical protein
MFWSDLMGSYEYGNEPSYSIKGKEFIAQVSDYQLLNKLINF